MRTFSTIRPAVLRSFVSGKSLAMAALLIGAAGLAASARADNVYWSVGVASPGVNVGVTNAHPMPVYVQPVPVYSRPAPVFVQPRPIYVQPAPIYVQPVPVYQSGWGHPGRGHDKHNKHGRRHDDDRHRGNNQGYQQGFNQGHAQVQPQYGQQVYVQPGYAGYSAYSGGGYRSR